jgi:tetratricopeptide (TPR) repeat protein
VVVGGGAYAFLGGKGAETVETAAPPPKTATLAPTPAPAVSDAAKMEAEMKALRAQSEAARAPVAAAVDDHLLTPVDRSAAVPIDRPMNAAGTPVAAPTAPTTQAKASSASDHESVGDDAARSGDWGTAAMAYKKAAAMDSRSAKLQLKLGEALLKSGDSNGAMGPLGTAGAGGQARAWKLLGDAARAQGDAAGANSYYQKYLATNPSDAAAVRSLLGGG